MLTKSRCGRSRGRRAGFLRRRRGHGHEHGRRRQARGGGRRDGAHRERRRRLERGGGDGAAGRRRNLSRLWVQRWGLARQPRGGRRGLRHGLIGSSLNSRGTPKHALRCTSGAARAAMSWDCSRWPAERVFVNFFPAGSSSITYANLAATGGALDWTTTSTLEKCNQRSRAQTAPRAPRGTRPRARTAQTGPGHTNTRGRRGDARGARGCVEATPRDRKALLTRYRVQSTLPPRRRGSPLLVPPDPRQRDGRPVVALRRGVTNIILISLMM